MINTLFIKILFLTTTFVVGVVSIFNFIIDPYQQYRKPSIYKTFYGLNQRAFNPGLARHHDYNSIIIGSSMTENFLISKASEIMRNPIKLSISGGSAHEIFLTLNSAFANNRQIDTILIGLDIYAVSGKSNRLRYGDDSIPSYLYDQNLFNDIFYLINFDTLKESVRLPLFKYRYASSEPKWYFEHMYQWQHKHANSFGKEKIVEQLKNYKPAKTINLDDYSFKNMKKSFNYNFLSLAKQHSDKDFIFFYPPYSIIAYKMWEENGTLDAILKFKSYAFEQFSKLNNVKVYDFHHAFEITNNLDNYKDYTHYSQEINNWMIDQMKHENYLVTKENIDQHLKSLRKQIKAYDLNATLHN